MANPFFSAEAHPLKAEIHKRNIRLWQLQHFTGKSSGYLSESLNGISVMDARTESLIKKAIKLADKADRQAGKQVSAQI